MGRKPHDKKLCYGEGCDRMVSVHSNSGLCAKHWQRLKKNGDPNLATSAVHCCEICQSSFVPRNGRQLVCDTCREDGSLYKLNREKAKARLQVNREERLAARKVYREANKEEIARKRREWYLQNREHAMAYARRYYRENPEKRKAWMDANRAQLRQWVQKRRTLLKSGGVFLIQSKELDAALRRLDSRCAYCKIDMTTKTVTWDHIIPISRGGTHSIGNLTACCLSCNSSKRDKTVMEWRVSGFCRIV